MTQVFVFDYIGGVVLILLLEIIIKVLQKVRCVKETLNVLMPLKNIECVKNLKFVRLE